MHDFFTSLLSDKKDGLIFQCFGLPHIAYIGFFLGLAVTLYFWLRNQDAAKRQKWTGAMLNIALGLYAADFFLMPLAYGEINIEKLPFHVCTTMCVTCFLSRHNRFFGKFRLQLAALGFVSNLVYLIYPAGVMWYGVHPLSYRAFQTLVFHGFMMVYGFLVLTFEAEEFSWRKFYRDAGVILAMTLWAMLGNWIYNSETQVFNWFFVVQDPFAMFPGDLSPWIMPPLNFVLFLTAELLVYWLFAQLRRCNGREVAAR